MDLNELLFHHQVALIGEAEDRNIAQPRQNLVEHFAGRVQELQTRLGVANPIVQAAA